MSAIERLISGSKIYSACDNEVCAMADAAQAELAELRRELESLKDPTAVHASILRGTIALTREQALHIAGATDCDALRAQLEKTTAALCSNLCSEHQTPDPLNCDTCNKVKWLESANLERMAQLDAFHQSERCNIDRIRELGSELETARQEIERLKAEVNTWHTRATAHRQAAEYSERGAKAAESDRDKALRVAEEAQKQLELISEHLCGVKVAGEITHDMVYQFVEGQIDKQCDRADKFQSDLSACRALLGEMERSRGATTDGYLKSVGELMDLHQEAIAALAMLKAAVAEVLLPIVHHWHGPTETSNPKWVEAITKTDAILTRYTALKAGQAVWGDAAAKQEGK